MSAPASLEDVFDRVKEGEAVALNIVLKADVAGSLEALQDQLAKVSTSQVGLNVLHTGVGGITQSDVMLAAASSAVIIGFNVRPLPEAKTLADQEGVEIRSYTVIYKITEELRAAMEGMLEPEEVEESLGMAEVRQTFRASRIGTIAGSHVVQGKITRGAKVRLVREGTIIYDGAIDSLQALQGRRQGSRGGIRVRNRARELQRHQGRRRDRGLRDPEGRADARVASADGALVPFLVALTIHLHLPDNGSLKGKRKELLSVRSALTRRFGASVAEVGAQDLWQRATLAAGPRGPVRRRARARRGRGRALSARPIPGGGAGRAPARLVRGPGRLIAQRCERPRGLPAGAAKRRLYSQ